MVLRIKSAFSSASSLALSLALQPCHKRLARLLVVGLTLASAQPACRRGPPRQVLLTTSRLGGVTAPCGCTSRPLGGLDRIAFLVEQAQREQGAGYLVSGDTFFADAAPSPAMRGHSAATGRIIADVLARLRPIAVAPGPRDAGEAGEALAHLDNDVRARLGLRLGDAATPPLAVITTQLAKQTLALVRVAPSLLDEEPAKAQIAAKIDAVAATARQQGAGGVAVLWPNDVATARGALRGLAQVDWVLCGSEGEPSPPEQVGSATLLDGGARGEHVGRLELFVGTGGRWQFYDGGAAEVAQLEQARVRMQAEALRLGEGPARAARLARAAALAQQQAEARKAKPQGAHFTWSLIDVEEALPKAPWASAMLNAYNQALCASAKADTGARSCAKAAVPAENYVGSASCAPCHAAAFAVYQGTAHARAWATLVAANKACDLSCVGCHVVGWEEAGGFCHLSDAERWANVGCESCHGPGQGHVQHVAERSAWGRRFVARPTADTCQGCHNAEHSDQFNFVQYLPKVLGPGHGLAVPAASP